MSANVLRLGEEAAFEAEYPQRDKTKLWEKNSFCNNKRVIATKVLLCAGYLIFLLLKLIKELRLVCPSARL